ncbi:MAG: VacJ family lipoprotein [Burkholderiaceae bacterium]|nr:VacJ family lipoprotein [Burkholderiaceae bacterium]
MLSQASRLFYKFLTLVACILTVGCAATQGTPNPADPWEGSNRTIYEFNDGLDRAVFRPVSEAYAFITPQPIRTCIRNIFLNLGEVWSGINSVLQQRQFDAINTMGRFLLNTTFGLGGCLDLASANGQPRIPNDFGVTLGVWGFSSGPYMVLPVVGSSSVRDTFGDVGNLVGNQLNTIGYIPNVGLRNSIWGLEFVSRREALLQVSETVDRTALDPYSFIRDAYLQQRQAKVLGPEAAADALPNYENYEDVEADDKALNIAPQK